MKINFSKETSGKEDFGKELAKTIFDSLIEGCQVIGFDWRYKYINPSAASQGKLRPEDLLGKTIQDSFPGVEKTELFSAYHRVMEDRVAHVLEDRFYYPDGTFNWFEFRINPVPEGIMILTLDISERKNEEFEKETISELYDLINTSPDLHSLLRSLLNCMKKWSRCEAVGIRLKDGDDYPYFATSGFSEVFVRLEKNLCNYDSFGNIEKDENGNPLIECMCGNIISERFDPSKSFFTTDGSFWSNCTTKLLSTTSDEDRQARTRNRCNGFGYESVALIPLRAGNETFGLLQFNDTRKGLFTPELIALYRKIADQIAISIARFNAEHALKNSHIRFRDLVENLDEMVFSINEDGVFQFVSSGVRKFGYSPEDLIGSKYDDFVNRGIDDVMLDESPFDTLAHSKGPIEFTMQDVFNKDRHVHVSAKIINDPAEAWTLRGVLIDQTERYNTELQLRAAQKMESIGRLAGGLAHDFNNYLSVILGNAEIMLTDIKVQDPFNDPLNEIIYATEKASKLTRQLLAFSRQQVMQPRVINLNSVIKDIEKMVRRLVEENIRIKTKLASELWNIFADPGQVEQVIMNLVVNARDAMLRDGQIFLETKNINSPQDNYDKITFDRDEDYVNLIVSDTGQGMAASTIDRIFEPFFTTKEPGKGTGLGLATVYGIVRQSGGDIKVWSEPGKGSVFSLFFPRDKRPPVTYSGEKTIKKSIYGQETILLVEDNISLRHSTERILSDAGYRVISAANGNEALFVCASEKPEVQLLLSDMIMPFMGGIDLYDKIKELMPGIKVLFMSGYAPSSIFSNHEHFIQYNFLPKPFSKNGLTEKIRDVLDRA
jgi:PAS domain S-box-containing protein